MSLFWITSCLHCIRRSICNTFVYHEDKCIDERSCHTSVQWNQMNMMRYDKNELLRKLTMILELQEQKPRRICF